MSYLHRPAFTFAGAFQADVPTGNNDASFYDAPPRADDPNNWNPLGGGQFRLRDTAVTSVLDDGTAVTADPIHAAVVVDADDRVAAKIVDLDTQWQLASTVWGLQVRVVANGIELLKGEFEPAAFRDITFKGLHARFVSVLGELTWAPPGTSGFIDRLRAATSGGLVAIRLTTYGFSGSSTIGSIVGTVGPYLVGEPRRFVAGRHFTSPDAGKLNDFDGIVTGDRVTVDLSNSLGLDTSSVPVDADVRLGLLTRTDAMAGAQVTENEDVILLGDALRFRRAGWLRKTGGLVTVDVPAAARPLIHDRPLALIGNRSPGTVLIRETSDGWLTRADDATRRLEPGASVSTVVHVTQYGRRVAGVQLAVAVAPPSTDATPVNGSPQGRVVVRVPSVTGADGRTTLLIEGDSKGPGHPRPHLEGQLYFVTFGGSTVGRDRVVIHLRDLYTAPDHPTWFGDVRPILAPYAVQYPLMTRRVFDLSDYELVRSHRRVLQLALSRPLTDPNYMPVTRDLSAAKQAMILRWLALPDLPIGTAPAGPQVMASIPERDLPQEAALTVVDDLAPFIGKRQTARENADLLASPHQQ